MADTPWLTMHKEWGLPHELKLNDAITFS